MTAKQKLELTWIGKEHRPKLEPRILLEDPEKSYHAAHRVTEKDCFDNRLIFGDNLLALKALEAEFAGKIKCVFIDPPYNTGSAFTHYDDGLEHSIWLSMMRDRLEIIRKLLSEDGSLWITVDDNEAHYLKVMCDEIFGRNNFVATVIWEKNDSVKSSARHFSVDHDYILVICKNAESWIPNLLARTEKQNSIYINRDNDPRGPWWGDNLSARNKYSLGIYPITTPSGRVIPGPPNGRYWAVSKEKLEELDKDNRIWWGESGNNVPTLKRFLAEVKQGRVPQTFWSNEQVGSTRESKKEAVALLGDDAFATPKPERLLERVIHLATNPGDRVLDSFAGSGTTGAVAHKMGRRWIMIELGEHCHTHIIPRLQKVIDGQDNGGITQGRQLARRRRLPLLSPRPLPTRARQMGQLGHQQNLQPRHAHRSPLQTRRLHLRPLRYLLLAARLLHRARLHLHHHPKPQPRPARPTLRRSRKRSYPAGALHGLSRQSRQIPQPHRQKNPQTGSFSLRMGPRRLQPQS
jgi:adenine-specific DNA-methyltransferase